ncbi:Nucleoporin Nup54 alpha-helical domain-containing protein [Caenorhabditis elegans]|uniref:Nucleoporin Nup54 alpha-helical domain-containing protein n=1 Tax=Caenorhabditis elegans TaxID=6239 RepID=Q9U3C1_CAEEL|nr:Nucleoporin Nup54 alpha-helical domain-containing protein [Caenorhabditis elegans]CAB54278.1 Nucleoporin Nup54 alpha-helical domain-containing protein [Caenorhabditis elegans]|eukprot:NP_501771.1 Nuclear Pore complex Protein [Caenorhabditis elegans]
MSLFGSSTPQKQAFTFPTPNAPTTSSGTLFGSTTPSKPLFGSTAQASSTPSLFGTTNTSTPSGGLFGKTGTSTTTTSTAGTLFGAAPTTSTATPSLFGASTTGSTPFGAASTGTAAGSTLFGSSTAKPATGGFFGSSSGSTLGGLGATQQQQQPVVQQQQVIQQYHPFVKAVGDPKLFGNDNDGVVAKLNQVAAGLGVGKAPYKDGNQLLSFSMEGNLFERFVGIGYNRISERTDDEGFVTLVLRHPITNLNTEERRDKILEIIKAILGGGPNVEVRYAPGTSMRTLSDGCTEICIIAKEGGFVAGAIKLAQILNDAPKMTQLESQLQVDKTRVLPKVGMSKAQRDRYLETVPDGIDERIWRQAIKENPAPNKLLPVPVRGWEALRDRQKAQVGESKLFHEAINALGNRVEEANHEHADAVVKMEIIRNRHKTLSYRIVRVMLAQWIVSRYSRQIDTDEDVIEAKADTLLAQMNRHNQVKFYVDKFYEILESKPDKLQESMWKMFDMTIEDEHYARRVLTKFVNICSGLYESTHQQIESLEACRRALEG